MNALDPVESSGAFMPATTRHEDNRYGKDFLPLFAVTGL